MIKSALQSSLTNDIKYRSMSAGAVPSSEYLIQTYEVGATPVSTVNFDLTGLSNIYKHLQIVAVTRITTATGASNVKLRMNGDTAANYSWHLLTGNGSTVTSGGAASIDYIYTGLTIGANVSTGIFAPIVIDILDPFNASKYTTTRGLTGTVATSENFVRMYSGNWRNTAPLTQLSVVSPSDNWAQGSRFSLYGVTA